MIYYLLTFAAMTSSAPGPTQQAQQAQHLVTQQQAQQEQQAQQAQNDVPITYSFWDCLPDISQIQLDMLHLVPEFPDESDMPNLIPDNESGESTDSDMPDLIPDNESGESTDSDMPDLIPVEQAQQAQPAQAQPAQARPAQAHAARSAYLTGAKQQSEESVDRPLTGAKQYFVCKRSHVCTL